jgi:Leucine-rich repeat (LRR) protein
MSFKKDLTKIPKRVIGSMISLKVLDLDYTTLKSLPNSVGCLKQLVFMSLVNTPIKTLPASLTNLVNLEILNLNGSSITELPNGLHKLASLKFLDVENCKDLQYLPSSILKLTSLQYLCMEGCESLWTKPVENRRKKVASIDNLVSLKKLKALTLQNNGKIISEGTLASMIEMDSLFLKITEVENLPGDMSNMPKLRRLSLECSHLVKMGVCELQKLSSLRLSRCNKLEELSPLHTLRSLRKLEIIDCPMLRKLPKEFGGRGAFPSLEIFSLAFLSGLEELPVVEEEAMLLLQIFTINICTELKILS